MLVKATRTGYLNDRRYRPGESFHLPRGMVLPSWTEAVQSAPDVPSAPSSEDEEEQAEAVEEVPRVRKRKRAR